MKKNKELERWRTKVRNRDMGAGASPRFISSSRFLGQPYLPNVYLVGQHQEFQQSGFTLTG